MSLKKYPMTVHGAEKLTQELEHLKRVERPRIIQAIAEARAHGDLKENAEYHAAKEQQGLTEARIRDIEHKLSHVHVIEVKHHANDGKVIFGATVTLRDLDKDTTIKFQIVGEDEADFKHHKISVSSPLARALIGKYSGDEVEINTPSGTIAYEIIQVEYI
ncbi:MAG: transcription elongation factor GreA [Gammaproteobacteria bacterium]